MLRKKLDELAPLFHPGGKLEKFYAMYEGLDTILYTPGTVTRTGSHVRDGLDLKRMMITVVVALLPCMLFAMYNVGYQSHLAIDRGAAPLDDWQTWVYGQLGLGYDPTDVLGCMAHGALYYLPIFIVTGAIGGHVEVAGAMLRGHEINEGFLVTWFLLPLTLPPLIPLWEVALGITFGVVFAKEIFVTELLLRAGGAFAAFSLITGAVYTMNDLVDADADREHPVKRL